MWDTIGQACGVLLVIALISLEICVVKEWDKLDYDLDHDPEDEEEDNYDTYHR